MDLFGAPRKWSSPPDKKVNVQINSYGAFGTTNCTNHVTFVSPSLVALSPYCLIYHCYFVVTQLSWQTSHCLTAIKVARSPSSLPSLIGISYAVHWRYIFLSMMVHRQSKVAENRAKMLVSFTPHHGMKETHIQEAVGVEVVHSSLVVGRALTTRSLVTPISLVSIIRFEFCPLRCCDLVSLLMKISMYPRISQSVKEKRSSIWTNGSLVPSVRFKWVNWGIFVHVVENMCNIGSTIGNLTISYMPLFHRWAFRFCYSIQFFVKLTCLTIKKNTKIS